MEVMIWVMEEVEDPVTPLHSPGVTPIFTSCSRTMLSPSRPGEGTVESLHNFAIIMTMIIMCGGFDNRSLDSLCFCSQVGEHP